LRTCGRAYLLVNTTVNGVNALYLIYDRSVNKLYLNNDADAQVASAPRGGRHPEQHPGSLNCAATTGEAARAAT